MARILRQPIERPAVSIVIPAYRATGYIASAIDSALAQTFADYEIIVVNDGCPETVRLEQILKPYLGKLVYIKQNNTGPAGARNSGIRAARGRLIAFLDADDYWAPNYLIEQMRFFETNPQVHMVYADALLVGDSPLAGRTFMELTPSNGAADFENLLTGRCTVVLSGTVVHRQRLLDVGLFDERLRRAEDYDLWLRLARAGSTIGYRRKALLFRRELPTGLCADTASLFLAELRVLAKVASQSSLTQGQRRKVAMQKDRMKAAIRLEQGKRAFELGEFQEAATAIRKANRVYDSWKLRFVFALLRVSPGLLLHLHYLRQKKLQAV